VRAFVTGGTGFIGQHVARKLRERGDEVVALVRSPEKGAALRELGCELVQGDLSSFDAIRSGLEGCDAAFHIAAVYKIGIPSSEREAMFDSNVRGTERVLDAAIAADVKRIVYVSTINVFGNTGGQVVDETYDRDASKGFLSVYDETKYRSHQIALDRVAKGAPIVMVQPGGVYGPGDHSEVGNMIDQTKKGKLKAKAFPGLGFNLVYVEDVADGILLAHDRGEIGHSYVLGGEVTTMGDLIDRVAGLAGRKAPKVTLPPLAIKALAPLGPIVGPKLRLPPNIRELASASDGVTYWARDDKARASLGYAPRDLETGLRETLAATAR